MGFVENGVACVVRGAVQFSRAFVISTTFISYLCSQADRWALLLVGHELRTCYTSTCQIHSILWLGTPRDHEARRICCRGYRNRCQFEIARKALTNYYTGGEASGGSQKSSGRLLDSPHNGISANRVQISSWEPCIMHCFAENRQATVNLICSLAPPCYYWARCCAFLVVWSIFFIFLWFLDDNNNDDCSLLDASCIYSRTFSWIISTTDLQSSRNRDILGFSFGRPANNRWACLDDCDLRSNLTTIFCSLIWHHWLFFVVSLFLYWNKQRQCQCRCIISHVTVHRWLQFFSTTSNFATSTHRATLYSVVLSRAVYKSKIGTLHV